MPESVVILDAVAIQRALTRIAHEIAERNEQSTDVVLVGHEPDLSDLARFLCGAQLVLKKCSLAVLEGQPRRGTMKLQLLLAPKQALALLGQA